MKTKSGKFKQWKPLKRGDLVDLVAPGWACSLNELQKGVKYLESLGLRVRTPENIFGKDLICANTAAERYSQLVKALKAKDSKAVWCVRGGYGALQLMPQLQKVKLPGSAKLLVGYSDVTTIHSWLNIKMGWATLHGPLVDRIGSDKPSAEERKDLEDVIFGRKFESEFLGLLPLNKSAKQKKNIAGFFMGGNLTVLNSGLGTPAAIKAKNKILFFEDTGERAYRLDRMMQQFAQSGAMTGIKAVVLGDFLGGDDKDGQNRVWDFWQCYADENKFPVYKGVLAGHGHMQRSVPLGVTAKLVNKAGAITLSMPTGASVK